MSRKILLITPSFKQQGGVVEFNKLLVKYGTSDFKVFQITSGLKRTTPGKVLAMSMDAMRLTLILLVNSVDLVHINPSLGKNAMRRDGNFLRIAKCFRKKVFVHWHGWNPDNEYLLKGKYLEWFKKMFFKADHIKVLSQQIHQKISETGFPGKLTLGNTFFDDDLLTDANTNLEQNRNFRLLFLSTVSRNKGIYTVLEVFEKVKQAHPEIELMIAGDGPELEKVKNYIRDKETSGVKFCGYVEGSEKRDTFMKSTVYLFPSSYEGMPTSVLEAMSFGLPIVCSDVGALPDFFEQEKMGFMIGTNQVNDYVVAIENLILDPDRMGAIATFNAAYARQRFTASNAVAVLERDYECLLVKQEDGQ